jgi:general secretion pathway protein F
LTQAFPLFTIPFTFVRGCAAMSEKFPEVGRMPVGDSAAGTISIEHLIALNDELAAIVRAGLPLERNLRQVGRDIPGTLGQTVQLLATRLSHGETLPQALAAERHRFPGVYRAVVEAGLKAGRLSAALEGLAAFARSYAELRRAIGMALIYPLIVLTLAYVLFAYFVLQIAPEILTTYSLFRFSTGGTLAAIERCRATLPYWGPILPVILAMIGVWWLHSGRAMLLQPAWTRRTLGWIPWLRGILANSRSACFADLLALLVEQEVPLPEAIVLAAETTADDALVAAARQVATAVERGEPVRDAMTTSAVFPPMLRWLMVTGLKRGLLAKSLRHAGQTYRELSMHHASLVKQLLPVFLLLAVGGTAAFTYCLSVFLPFVSLLNDLSAY